MSGELLRDCPQKISVILPAFNEEAIIQEAIRQTGKVLANGRGEIIVVDDGSRDNTYALAAGTSVENVVVKAVRYPQNHGKGYALRYGFAHATGDLIVFLDADLDLPPQQIGKLYAVMQAQRADVVIGCKHHQDSEMRYPWRRRLFSLGYYALVKLLFGLPLRDTQTGLKLFRREVLERIFPRIRVSGFTYDLEILIAAVRYGYHIAEAPVQVVFNTRRKLGGINWRTVGRMWLDTLRIFGRASFWEWWRPSLTARLWLLALGAGLLVLGAGVAHALAGGPWPAWVVSLGYYLTLEFVPRLWRAGLLIGLGGGLILAALLQLNKSLLRAFLRADDGDLAGITRGRQAPPAPE